MTVSVDMGRGPTGETVTIDLEELLATRLLVQGNSGSGKSHLLRRILEGSAGLVQQVVIDPEGDFVSLSEAFGHVSIDAAEYSLVEIGSLASRLRQHRASVVLNLEGLEVEGIVVNQFQARASLPQQILDELIAEGLPVLPVYLASSVRMRESHQANTPLIHLDPRHKLTQQFVELHSLLENA